MSNIFTTPAKNIFSSTAATAEKKETKKSELFINIGIPVDIDGQQQFINIPLVLTADRLAEAIVKERAKIGKNATNAFTQIIEGKAFLGETVEALFAKMQAGDSLRLEEIPDDSEFALLKRLQIQFIKAGKREDTPEQKDAKEEIRAKLLG